MLALDALIDQAEKDWPTLQARLERIRDVVVKKENLVSPTYPPTHPPIHTPQ